MESILEEAQRLTSTDRTHDYGHPLDDWSRTMGMFNELFAHKLKEPFTPEDGCLFMVLVKLSRQVNHPKRDNLVDGSGYMRLVDMIEAERARRQTPSSSSRH